MLLVVLLLALPAVIAGVLWAGVVVCAVADWKARRAELTWFRLEAEAQAARSRGVYR
jgi:hypothetical protein